MGDVELREGAVAWLQSAEAPAWPVVLQMRRNSYWRVKLLGDHGRQVTQVVARPAHLADFASNIHHAASKDAALRVRLVGAARAAIEHVRTNGLASQRERMDTDGLLQLLSVLVPPGALPRAGADIGVGEGEGAAPAVAVEQEKVAHLERCRRAVKDQEEYVLRCREQCERAKRGYEGARAALREAKESVTNAERRAVNAETRLAACDSDVKHGLVELQTRQLALRAADALIRECSVAAPAPASGTGGNAKRAAAAEAEADCTRKRQCFEEEVIDEGSAEVLRPAAAALPVPPPPIVSTASAATTRDPATQVMCAAIEIRPNPAHTPAPAPAREEPSTPNCSESTETVGSPEYVPPASLTSTISSTPPTVMPLPASVAARGPAAAAGSRPPRKAISAVRRSSLPSGGTSPGAGASAARRTSLPRSMSGTPLQRRGKRLEITIGLPAAYTQALEALGRRRLAAATGAGDAAAAAGGEAKTRVEVFREDLRAYQMSRGHDVHLPNLGGVTVDLYKLVRAFLRVGGLEVAIRMRALSFVLREAEVEFTNSYYTHRLKTFYAHFVHPYEHHLVHGTAVAHDNALRIIDESKRRGKNDVK